VNFHKSEESMNNVTNNTAPKWNLFSTGRLKMVTTLLLVLMLGATFQSHAGLLGDILDPIVGEEGEEGEAGLLDDLLDPVLDEEAEDDGLIEDILDPVLGDEGEDEGGLVDDILDPVLDEEGEEDDGLIDDVLDPVLGDEGEGDLLDDLLNPVNEIDLLDDLLDLLPLPILGPDAYEPDNSPLQAVWSGLLDLTGLNALDILTRLQTHNFHVEGDMDWKRFYAQSGQTVAVETLDLLSQSDTFVSVYRQLDEGEVVSIRPTPCLEDAIEGPDGTTLVPVACNDDAPSGFDRRRSHVQFLAPRTGFYYVRIQYSPKLSEDKDGGETFGSETTYNYTAVSSGIYASSLYCTVQASEDDSAITNGIVELNPFGIQQSNNFAGTYPLDGIPSGQYALRVTAPGRKPHVQSVQVFAGQMQEVFVSLAPESAGQDGGGSGSTEGETPGSEGELEVPEGETGGPEGETDGPEGETGGPEGETGGPEGETGEHEGEHQTTPSHAADYAAPYGELSLGELLRGTQLYNARAYHCDANSEDGYAPFYGPRVDCAPHTSDYVDGDWSLSLSELLRLMQLFNLGGYHACASTEDGYCPKQKV